MWYFSNMRGKPSECERFFMWSPTRFFKRNFFEHFSGQIRFILHFGNQWIFISHSFDFINECLFMGQFFFITMSYFFRMLKFMDNIFFSENQSPDLYKSCKRKYATNYPIQYILVCI